MKPVVNIQWRGKVVAALKQRVMSASCLRSSTINKPAERSEVRGLKPGALLCSAPGHDLIWLSLYRISMKKCPHKVPQRSQPLHTLCWLFVEKVRMEAVGIHSREKRICSRMQLVSSSSVGVWSSDGLWAILLLFLITLWQTTNLNSFITRSGLK